MAAKDYKNFFKEVNKDSFIIEDYKDKILDLLENEENLKKAALIIEQLINEKTP